MLPLRTQSKQHDDEVDSSANATPRPPQAQFSFLWPHSVPFGRLHRSLYVRLCDLDFLVPRAIWCMVSCCVRLVVGTWRAFLL